MSWEYSSYDFDLPKPLLRLHLPWWWRYKYRKSYAGNSSM